MCDSNFIKIYKLDFKYISFADDALGAILWVCHTVIFSCLAVLLVFFISPTAVGSGVTITKSLIGGFPIYERYNHDIHSS